MGKETRTQESLVALAPHGQVVKARTVRRLAVESERWSAEAVLAVRGRPRMPFPDDDEEGGDPEVCGDEPGVFAAESGAGLPDLARAAEPVIKRDFKITKRILDKYGYTEGCRACGAHSRGTTSGAQHTRECRSRLEKLMTEDPEERGAIHGRDIRHGLRESERRAGRPIEPEQVADPGQGTQKGEEAQEEKEESDTIIPCLGHRKAAIGIQRAPLEDK